MGIFYNFYAKKTLTSLISPEANLKNTVNQIISDPSQAFHLLMQQTELGAQKIQTVIQAFFLSGYHSAVSLLIIISALALVVIGLVMKPINYYMYT